MKLQRLTTPLMLAAALWTGAAHAQSAALWTGAAHAQSAAPVTVDGAWARASVQGQTASGAFMRLTAPEATRLVRIESNVAGVTEVHEMKVEGDVMKMRALPGLDLPAGQVVELKPGGYHIMLMDLKAPLVKGSSVPLTLVFRDAKGIEHPQQVQLPVATSAPGGQGVHAAPMHKH